MILAIANQKGGVGKTTTVANLAVALAAGDRPRSPITGDGGAEDHAGGRRVLAVDLDPQASLTFYLGQDEGALEEAGRTLYHGLVGGTPLEDLVVRVAAGIDLVPAGIALAKAEAELLGEPNGALVLKELLAPLAASYDAVLLDCPPSLGMLTVNALNAAGGVLIPVKTQLLSLIGLAQILETIRKVRRRANPGLRVVGILPTMHHARHAHDGEVLREIGELYHELRVLEPIPSTTRLARLAGADAGGGPPPLGHEAYARVAAALLETRGGGGGAPG